MTGILRNPMATVIAGGNPMPFKEFEVKQSRTKKGDTFTLKAALSGIDLNFWLTTTPIPVQITINATQIFTGNVDHSGYGFSDGDFDISGRDTGAALIDAMSNEKFLNQTPSAVVQTLASRAGLTVDSDVPSDDAGKIYSTDFDSITHRGSSWSGINHIADHYGMNAYTTGGVLYFKYFDEVLTPYPINYTAPTPESFADGTFILLKCSRNHILGRPVTVNVRSHNHRAAQVYSATAQSSGGTGTPLIYNHTIPGISQSQANTIAQAKLAEVQAHELKLDGLEFPGDETVNARMAFVLSGTNSPFDQSYDAETITHKFSFTDGYRTSVDCKNKKGS